jgi:hypothetical protein
MFLSLAEQLQMQKRKRRKLMNLRRKILSSERAASPKRGSRMPDMF